MIALLEAKSPIMYLFNRGKHVHERTVLKQNVKVFSTN